MRRLAAACACAAIGLAAAAPARAAPVVLAEVGRFAAPVYVAAAPGDLRRVFVVERAGTIQLIDGGARSTFADLSSVVLAGDERGLLSMAFAPDYATSGLFYVYYTARSPVGAITIEERRRDPADLSRADPGYRRPLLQIPHDVNANHNGGQLQVGPDGALWAGTGDGGGGGDSIGNGQNLTQTDAAANRSPLLGKLLRLSRAGGPAPGNPYPAPAAEVAFFGLRNPWRFAFDRATGDLAIADVGQGAYEEVDFIPAAQRTAGANFGWNRYEGLHVYPGGGAAGAGGGTTLPVAELAHSDGWCSITGGYVVRDPALPELAGTYVFGDFCKGRIYGMTLPSGTPRDLGLPSVASISSFGEDGCGRVYIASLDGIVYRLASTGACATAATAVSGGAPAAADRTPPRTRLVYARRQHVLRNGRVSMRVSCDELCTLRARGTVLVSRVSAAAVRRTRTVRRTIVANAPTLVRMTLSKTLRRRVARSLRRGGRSAVVRVEIRATDATGNVRTSTRRVRIAR